MTRKLIVLVTLAWIATYAYQTHVHAKHERCVTIITDKLYKSVDLTDRQKRELAISISYFCYEENNDIYDTLEKLNQEDL